MDVDFMLMRIRVGMYLTKPVEREKKKRIIRWVMAANGELLDYIYKSTNAIVQSRKKRV